LSPDIVPVTVPTGRADQLMFNRHLSLYDQTREHLTS
jgi:hypothetical protein